MNCRMPRTRVSRFELLSRQQASSSARLPTPTPESSSLRERQKKRGIAWVPHVCVRGRRRARRGLRVCACSLCDELIGSVDPRLRVLNHLGKEEGEGALAHDLGAGQRCVRPRPGRW